MTDIISTTITTSAPNLPSSTFLPSTFITSTLLEPTITSTSVWETPTGSPQPSSTYNNDKNLGMKVGIPVGFIGIFGIFILGYYFLYRGKKRSYDRRLKAAGIPLGQRFPPSVFPVPLPRPKTPPSPIAAPVYREGGPGEGGELPPPGYAAGTVTGKVPPPGY